MRYLADTSVLIEYLRGTEAIAARMDALRREHPVVTCDPVTMELLAGASGPQAQALEAFLDALPLLAFDAHHDFREAAAIHRRARRSGRTIRSLTDCLIAAIVLRHEDITLIHNDVDFERIADVVPLRQERWAT